ncbi:unnamed protein product [Prorocentrum cordatum]|uniref:Polynucleotide adenylyltransferase n=1 Tax=Prorocentrum cordatum TaxID=2364126 RepID=A0ABN9R5U4_9DINO|nr:unnamed protein product [Polarella glacialis]
MAQRAPAEPAEAPQPGDRRVRPRTAAAAEALAEPTARSPKATAPAAAPGPGAPEASTSAAAGERATEGHLAHPVLRLREARGEGVGEVFFEFRNTPASEVRRVDTEEDLRALLAEQAARAARTAEHWVRQPRARWITQMVEELPPSSRSRLSARHARLRMATVPREDVAGRWMETMEFASYVLHLWFEGRSLEDVLARAEELGHTGPDGLPGCILHGSFAREISSSRDVDFAGLLPMVKRMSTRDDGLLSVYKVCAHNCFDQEQVHSLRPDELQPLDGQGSLNTTWDFGFGAGGSGVDLIDDFHRQVDSSLRDCDAVSLNRRLYLIWKFQHYVTSYHQDTHVPPHFTIYNQVCGYSVLNFLPLLVGLFVTHVGRAGPLELQRVLGELDRRGVGSLGTLGPDRVALITPFGSHGVWVPSVAHNPSLRPFEVSLMRAAELYARPVLDRTRQALRGGRWNHAVEPTAAEQAQARAFAAAQERICEDLGLTRSEWALLARETWEAWSQDSDEEQERCQ